MFQNKALRKMFNPILNNKRWKIRKNREFRDIYKHLNIVSLPKSHTLRWPGHVWWREENITVKKCIPRNMRWQETSWQPRMRWKDEVMRHYNTGYYIGNIIR